MKKRIRIVSIILTFLSLTSCDFVRKIAGRPTSGELAEKSELIEQRRKRQADSLQKLESERIIRENFLRDSLAAAAVLKPLGIDFSYSFSFGEPVDGTLCRYNAVVGVYRTKGAADKALSHLRSKGCKPGRIFFSGGEMAVLLCSSDSLSEVVTTLMKARAAGGICPKDTWIYITPLD